MAAEVAPSREVRRGRLRAVLAPGADLVAAIGPDGDPDRVLTSARCWLRKFQRKVVVGRMETAVGALYVKRYNVFGLRVALEWQVRGSPAWRAYRNACVLRAHGFGVPTPFAALEYRTLGVLTRSFFVTREVADAVTVDEALRRLLAIPEAGRRRRTRRAFATALGTLFRDLHRAGIYHPDLKDVNVLVTGDIATPRFVLLDLERVRCGHAVARRRRVKNLVQLARTLGRHASRTDRLRLLAAYVDDRRARRAWARAILRAQRRKDRTRGARAARRTGKVTCTVVCQDEAAQIAQCLESVAWCDEIVVIDGGSVDATPAIARRYTERLLFNPWPGYRAQKALALAEARSEWVLNLDADERVSDELAHEIDWALGEVRGDVDGFAIPRLVSYLGRWWWYGGWYPRRVVRLVRRAHTTWGGIDPHDRAEVPGRICTMRAPLFHYTYEDVGDHLRTVTRLTRVAADEVEVGRRVGLARLALEPAWRFFRFYLVKQGFREGLPGFFVAATDAFYVFLRWARVWERDRNAAGRDDARG